MQRINLFLGLAATSIVLASLLGIPAGAQASTTGAAQGIEISPALVELNAARGKTYTVTIKVTNVTASDLVYTTSADDFNAADETGSPHILLNSNLPANASIKSWVQTFPQFTLGARQPKVVTAQITVPDDAEPGGHYGVLRFSGKTPELKDTGVGLSASAGVLLLIRVDGDITEKASLASFYSAASGSQSSLFESSPISFVTRIKNEGNIHVKPIGSIEIRDMFGGTVGSIPVNKDRSNVLPSSIRRFESATEDKWMIGRYTANLTLGYGTTGQAITNTISFWVVPYKIILTALLVLATIIFIFSRVIKVYNKRIIAKSKHESTAKSKKNSNKKG